MDMMKKLMDCSLEELQTQFTQNVEVNRYQHDVAVLCGSLGIHPEKYSSFIKTMDDIERNAE